MLVEDVTIVIQELIQNGEDAKASKISFILDERSYGTDSLLPKVEGKEGFARMQGPALFVYNNATFTEQDWRGIRNPRVGSKKEDPDKVGKFGMGFSSVYHVTGDSLLKTFVKPWPKTLSPQTQPNPNQFKDPRWTARGRTSCSMGTSSILLVAPFLFTLFLKSI